jgi:hypothetical protein
MNHQQVRSTQDDNRASAQLQDVAASHNTNARANSRMGLKYVKCVSPRTFSQKLYQSYELEIAEEFERAIDVNSLEEVKKLLDKVLELDEGK